MSGNQLLIFVDAQDPVRALMAAQDQVLDGCITDFNRDKQTYRITMEWGQPEPEQPQWWYWQEFEGWEVSADQGNASAYASTYSARIYGTTDDREAKVQAITDAIKAGGKP